MLQCGDVTWLFACYNQIMESLNTEYDHRIEVGPGVPLEIAFTEHFICKYDT